MNKTTVLAALVVVLAAGAATAACLERQSTIRHAGDALARANEYFDAGALFFEPRYAEAEKAVADANSTLFRDPLAAEGLRACLVDVKLSRSYMEMSGKNEELVNREVKDKDTPQLIAESRALLDDTQRKMAEFMAKASKCAPATP
jgi:hypothetical protein